MHPKVFWKVCTILNWYLTVFQAWWGEKYALWNFQLFWKYFLSFFSSKSYFFCCLKRLPSYLKTITSRLLKCLRLPSFYLVGNWTLESLRARMGHKNELKLAQYEIQHVKLNRIPLKFKVNFHFICSKKNLWRGISFQSWPVWMVVLNVVWLDLPAERMKGGI